jgi:hypothetical protein
MRGDARFGHDPGAVLRDLVVVRIGAQLPQQMAQRFDAELPRAEAAEMWTATFVLVGLKYDRAFARVLLHNVPDTMRESTT